MGKSQGGVRLYLKIGKIAETKFEEGFGEAFVMIRKKAEKD